MDIIDGIDIKRFKILTSSRPPLGLQHWYWRSEEPVSFVHSAAQEELLYAPSDLESFLAPERFSPVQLLLPLFVQRHSAKYEGHVKKFRRFLSRPFPLCMCSKFWMYLLPRSIASCARYQLPIAEAFDVPTLCDSRHCPCSQEEVGHV